MKHDIHALPFEKILLATPTAATTGNQKTVPPPPLGLHRNIEQYVYYPAVVPNLSALTVRTIILFINAAILRINPLPPECD